MKKNLGAFNVRSRNDKLGANSETKSKIIALDTKHYGIETESLWQSRDSEVKTKKSATRMKITSRKEDTGAS